jgi:hypothetical protein
VKVAPLGGERQSDEGSADQQQGERAEHRGRPRPRQTVSRININQRIHAASSSKLWTGIARKTRYPGY